MALCRICLNDDDVNTMQPLFDADNSSCAEIVQQIEECGGIVLKPHEEFPKMICVECLGSLKISYKFRTMCQTSENALLDAIVKSELKTEPHDVLRQEDSSESRDDKSFFLEFIDAEEVLDIDDEKQTYACPLDNEDANSQDYNLETESESTGHTETDSEAEEKLVKKSRRVHTKSVKRGRSRGLRSKILRVNPTLPKSGRGRKKIEETSASIMCEVCGNIYNKQSLLNMHMRRHLEEKPYECEICGKTFACPSAIGRHMRIHTGEKPYVCKFCGRTFTDRSTNIKHERIHTNERPFSCKTCGKSFTYSNVLKNHMLTHTGEKPFPCLACNKTFSRKHQLDQHCATITHQQTIKNLSIPVIAMEAKHLGTLD